LNVPRSLLVAYSYFLGFQWIWGLSRSRLLDDSARRLIIRNLFSSIVVRLEKSWSLSLMTLFTD
jgi:hypothetical protein